MTAALARRAGAAALTVMLTGAAVLLGSGTAQAQSPRQIECTINLGQPLAPVAVREGEQVQLVLNLLGTRISVGPSQTVTPGMERLTGDLPLIRGITDLLGLVGQVCQAVVQVQTTVTSVVPLPPVTLPDVPLLPPQQTVNVPLPGVDVGLGQQPAPEGPQTPGPTQPVPSQPGAQPSTPSTGADTPAGTPGYRFEPGRLPMYDFSRAPYSVSSRFGQQAAPAFRFGQRLPGYSPQFGVLGEDDVAEAGDARALPVGPPDAVELPVLLAVLMLSAVAGALVRTWVLRRAV